MKKLFGIFFFIFIILINYSFVNPVYSQNIIDLKGEWEYLPYEGDTLPQDILNSTWPTMNLPSNWFLLGQKNYPSNLKADSQSLASNETGKLWPVDINKGFDYAGTVWFRKKVFLSAEPKKQVILDLDMVDYYADVYVNGKCLKHHEGYFQPWSVNITPAIKTGFNEILIKVSAPKLVFDMSQQFPIGWPKNQNQIKGIFLYHDTRPGATSWRGQEQSTGGILKSIKIRYSSGIDTNSIMVSPTNVSSEKASLKIKFNIQNWTNQTKNIVLNGTISPYNFKGYNTNFSLFLKVPPGLSSFNHEILIKNPKLWWTWDMGDPNLYKINTSLINQDNQTIDNKSSLFGIRSISKDPNWVWYLNGKRIYVRGSNYISTQWLSQADEDWYEKDIKLMKDANLNAIRVHAHLERSEFYDIADKNGILVWQDFPLQWGYTDLPSFQEEALSQVQDMVNIFYNHPSIALWCMHNEAPYAMSWMEKRNPNQNLDLDNKLVEKVRDIDKTRIIHRDSGTGDGHPYPGWYSGPATDPDSFKSLDTSPMITEYGAQALPDIRTLKSMFSTQTLFPKTQSDFEIWKFLDFQPQENFETAKIVQGENIYEFINNSQQYQANLIKYITERQRQQKCRTSTGLFQFMFVDDWPSITWSTLDYYRLPKKGYLSLKESMQPLLASISYKIYNPDDLVEIFIINDYDILFKNLTLKWEIGDGKIHSKTLNINPDSSVRVVSLGYLPMVTKGDKKLSVWIENNKGQIISQNSLSSGNFIK